MFRAAIVSLSIATAVPLCGLAGDDGLLQVRGRGVEDRPAYQGGGTVRFLDLSLGAQVVHFDGGNRIPLPLRLSYEVIEPAPILLTSRMGTEHWRLYSFHDQQMVAMYSDEKVDLSQAGKHSAQSTRAWFHPGRSQPRAPGLVGIRGHYYFLIDRPDGKWLDVVDPPPFFDRPELARKTTFTLADLSKYTLSIEEIQSTWQPVGPFRVRLLVTDAQGRKLPVVNAPLVATADNWQTKLSTEWGLLNEPTGWMLGKLPEQVPSQLTVHGQVALQTSTALEQREVKAVFTAGQGTVEAREFRPAGQRIELPRNRSGTIRETRAIWASTDDIASPEAVEQLVRHCKLARLNMIVIDIFVRNTFAARSNLIPHSLEPDKPDRLAELIRQAHAAGLEVHPWFCVTYRDAAFRQWFRGRAADVTMIDRSGRPMAIGADVHRPEYRRFIVELMVGVARDYEVDGIHLDYIRSMGQCYCEKCRAEFARQFGTPLEKATDEQWIQWQREAIGDIVRRTALGVRKARPHAMMSAAVFANMDGGAFQGQDPAGWARHGWMDLIIPMDYRMQTLEVRANERRFLDALDNDDQLVTGLSLYMRSGKRVSPRPPELVREQIELVRRMNIHGYCLFAHSHLSDEQIDMLRNEVNRQPAVPYFR